MQQIDLKVLRKTILLSRVFFFNIFSFNVQEPYPEPKGCSVSQLKTKMVEYEHVKHLASPKHS